MQKAQLLSEQFINDYHHFFLYKFNHVKPLHLLTWTLNALRQEVQLLSENFINGQFFFYFFYNMPMYPTNKSSSVTQNIEAYTLKSHVIPHKSCANVLVLEQVKHVNSQLPKVSNKLKQIQPSDHVFKLLSSLMKLKHKVLG